MVNKLDTRIFSINDIYKWYKDGELDFSPKYQRNSVWNNSAKSFLIDTILKSFSVPPIYLRQIINIDTKSTKREIVDGQQRIRSILDFLDDKYKILKSQNAEYGNKTFSMLDDVAKKAILNYQLAFVVVNIEDDNEIYDIFFRLNTNNYVLNRQEIRNAKFWGEYKVAVLNYSAKFRSQFINKGFFSDKQVARMADVEFASMLVNVLINGVQTESANDIDNNYKNYDSDFKIYNEIKEPLEYITNLCFDYSNFTSEHYCFKSKVYFYTLFVALGCLTQKINKNIIKKTYKKEIRKKIKINKIYSILKLFEDEYNDCIKNGNTKNKNYNKINTFYKLHMTHTTNKNERIKRINILIDYILNSNEKL